MANKIHVQPLGWLARTFDVLMIPIMYIVSGTFQENPQQTHRWNNSKLNSDQIAHLKNDMKVLCRGVSACSTWCSLFPIFHLPIFGGWRDYVVLQPKDTNISSWHVGWIAGNTAGISRIKLHGLVRMLLGPGDVSFFGVNAKGEQISIHQLAQGRIGSGGQYSNVPLL